MQETDTLSALNQQDEVGFSTAANTFLLITHFHPKGKAHPFQSFNVIVMTDFVQPLDASIFCNIGQNPWDADAPKVFLAPKDWGAAALMAALGIFESKGQAKKNGWPGAIPDGWSELRVGTHMIFVWKPTI